MPGSKYANKFQAGPRALSSARFSGTYPIKGGNK